MGELWRAIPGYEGIYEVSDQGRVKRLSGTKLCVKERILRTWLARGYPHLTLNTETNRHHFDVHRLVMLAFVGPCPDGHNVNHKDGVKTNNLLSNLEYVTFSENNHHAVRLGLFRGHCTQGTANPRATLTDDQVLEIRAQIATGKSGTKIAADFGVTRNVINKIGARVTWRHLEPLAA